MTWTHPLPTLFPAASAQGSSIQTGQLFHSVQAALRELQTGLLEITIPGPRRYGVLFVRGQLVNVYLLSPANRRVTPVSRLEKVLAGLPADELSGLRGLSLTAQAVRLLKIWIEQKDLDAVTPLKTAQLPSYLEEKQSAPLPQLVHINWPSADALILFPGAGASPHHTLFIAAEHISQSEGGLLAPLSWGEAECSVVALQNIAGTPAWDEYLLHHSFTSFVSAFLTHFKELTGRTLLNSLVREFNFTTTAHGWDIAASSSGIIDQTIFTSPEETADVYRRLLQVVFRQVESVLGEANLRGVVKGILSNMETGDRKIFQKYLSHEVDHPRAFFASVR